jgi:MFS family permease
MASNRTSGRQDEEHGRAVIPAESPESPETTPLLSGHSAATTNGLLDRSGTGAEGEAAVARRDEDDDEQTVLVENVSTAKLTLIFCTVYVGVLLAAVDTTIMATLSGPISSEFKSLSLLSWLATAYLISNAAFQPISGRLTDIFGRGPGLVFSNVVFAAGNLICGLAKDPGVMIFGRVIAGIGGGGLLTISTFIGSDLIPLRKRGVIQGLGNIVYGGGNMLGGVFGGYVHDNSAWGWRLAFLVQVPPALISAVLVFYLVRIPPKASKKSFVARIDFVGVFLTIVFLVLLLLGLNSGGNLVPWNHPLPIITLSTSVFAFAGFWVWESRARQPIIPVRLVLQRTVLAACLCNFLCTMVVMMALFYLPLYLQVTGLSASEAGIRLLTSPLGISMCSIGSGYIMKRTGRYRVLGIVMLLLVVSGIVVATTLDLYTPSWRSALSLFLIGGGYGGMLTITLLACIAAVDHSQQAVITASTCKFPQLENIKAS